MARVPYKIPGNISMFVHFSSIRHNRQEYNPKAAALFFLRYQFNNLIYSLHFTFPLGIKQYITIYPKTILHVPTNNHI